MELDTADLVTIVRGALRPMAGGVRWENRQTECAGDLGGRSAHL